MDPQTPPPRRKERKTDAQALPALSPNLTSHLELKNKNKNKMKRTAVSSVSPADPRSEAERIAAGKEEQAIRPSRASWGQADQIDAETEMDDSRVALAKIQKRIRELELLGAVKKEEKGEAVDRAEKNKADDTTRKGRKNKKMKLDDGVADKESGSASASASDSSNTPKTRTPVPLSNEAIARILMMAKPDCPQARAWIRENVDQAKDQKETENEGTPAAAAVADTNKSKKTGMAPPNWNPNLLRSRAALEDPETDPFQRVINAHKRLQDAMERASRGDFS
ncbi:hypothetical protein ASPZODRAFT_142812 [Penicilliopsis zonata CBS 506.65]|uniref:Uncharacterized protein n=1 Tax=Penicilliopsis zonata CBS 506.65 TaxID=1073090 RepID=A0A1L9SG97_9EURO|nr:hypothetical protein ASPZODRAFT_142812 [Penicilliopsis zonata CBS 506.65]OJJ46191.1 hypothetical protein ASPZODRAFT_142812 [Penicilliopsis zonata CBS 506.65]